jgi:threonine dehydrogenase-like Zn-dependent dehydrogenase
VNDVAPARDQDAPVVVAGVAPVARLVTAALLRVGLRVVGLVDPLDEPDPEPSEFAAELDAGKASGHYVVTEYPAAGTGPTIALVTEPSGDDAALSPAERYTAALAPGLRPGALLVVASPTAEHTGGVVAATVELLTGLRAGPDYALAHLFGPVPNGRLIISGVDVASATRAEKWLAGLGLPVMPVLPVAAAEVVAGLLGRAAARPDDETEFGDG